MLVKMFGKMWRVIGTDSATGEPIYEPVENAAPTTPLPTETNAVGPPKDNRVVPESKPVVYDGSSPALNPLTDENPFQKKKAAAIPQVIEKQVSKGKSLTPPALREKGPVRRPDGSTIPPESTSGLGCACKEPCFCVNPSGYESPWELAQHSNTNFDQYDVAAAGAAQDFLDSDFHKVGDKFVSNTEGEVIVKRFGEWKKMTGYDDTTGEPIYVDATPEEVAAVGSSVVEVSGAGPAITGNYGFASGTDSKGKACETEHFALDFKRYGITARPGSYRMIPQTPEDIVNFRRNQEEMDRELTEDERQLGRNIAGEE